ncbi:MAG: hypothetical protein ILA34_04720 [Bacteroidaceae bacterium]|nr:hypothetical protein [Bacteroidaceae bacterium]
MKLKIMKRLDLGWQDARPKKPFRVPEGYFESFTARLMEKIPHAGIRAEWAQAYPHQSLFVRLRPMLYAAAVCCSLIFGVEMYLNQLTSPLISEQTAALQLTSQEVNEYIDDFCDFARINEQDIYACVADNN